ENRWGIRGARVFGGGTLAFHTLLFGIGIVCSILLIFLIFSFLMVVSYDEPHHPFTCPVEYLEKYADFYYELGEKAQDDLAN
ncbi:hypothetical protein MMP16_28295, partial [Escherichia coli]|nr:hypothetical protein [Escherichia coli]